MRYTLHTGDSAQVLKTLPANSVDAVVTDPPYGLSDTSPERVADCLAAWARGEEWTPPTGAKGFMGKAWDSWVPGPELWREVARVLKPGGHALVFAGSRTQDLMSIALRLAGFEVRDTLQWLYSSSAMSKSHDISKAIDREAGAEREVIGVKTYPDGKQHIYTRNTARQWVREGGGAPRTPAPMDTAPATDAARAWEGWGTALRPAYEPVILARKPLDGTAAQNTLTHGCGGLNIDGCRVGSDIMISTAMSSLGVMHDDKWVSKDIAPTEKTGRFPRNILFDEGAATLLDAQTGKPTSRFFYCAKASSAEREAGLESDGHKRANTHPTIKPLALMRYLVRLITPPGGLVLDPFTGSGSTGCAVMQEGEGRRFVGVELSPEYADIARARLAHYAPADTSADTDETGEQLSLF